jgi:hypothetical protein
MTLCASVGVWQMSQTNLARYYVRSRKEVPVGSVHVIAVLATGRRVRNPQDSFDLE